MRIASIGQFIEFSTCHNFLSRALHLHLSLRIVANGERVQCCLARRPRAGENNFLDEEKQGQKSQTIEILGQLVDQC